MNYKNILLLLTLFSGALLTTSCGDESDTEPEFSSEQAKKLPSKGPDESDTQPPPKEIAEENNIFSSSEKTAILAILNKINEKFNPKGEIDTRRMFLGGHSQLVNDQYRFRDTVRKITEKIKNDTYQFGDDMTLLNGIETRKITAIVEPFKKALGVLKVGEERDVQKHLQSILDMLSENKKKQ